ncbi:hypothetical protein ATZ36_11535 [Candidatus Endomicrobiellum trichonymphae]|uniref:Uncharacterized protein n=1 Tax=Endomicrobium trichonymphae TaxID=1408204 RepID=A0A1E5IG12_ENDTX|nr:hypothetical protein ATZ36_11535 [Candidatus Endomicrobium trichonymphae]
MLIKYPKNKKLKQNLHTQAKSGFSWGKRSDNLKGKITNLEKLIKDWLEEELNDFNKILKDTKEQEERVNF